MRLPLQQCLPTIFAPPGVLLRARIIQHSRCLYSTTTQSTTAISVKQKQNPQRHSLPPQHPIEQYKSTLHTLRSRGLGDVSKIELALRGLEQRGAAVRIAVVGAAHELLPALFGPELKQWITGDGRGLLLRFGTSFKMTTPVGSPLAVLTAPIEALQTHNVEIVLPRLHPVTMTPGTRVIEYPVHKTLVYGSGAAGVEQLLQSRERGNSVLHVLSLQGCDGSQGELVQIVDLDRGLGVAAVREWLLAGTTVTGNPPKPAIRTLLRDILETVQTQLQHELQTVNAPPIAITATPDSADSLARAIKAWSASAHSELQSATFTSRKLEWWKLLWRADDVGAVCEQTLTQQFLPHSEAAATFLAGRLQGAGFPAAEETNIPQLRSELIDTLVPELQVKAQRLLVASISTAGLTGVLSALLVASGAPVYSALTVVAVGAVGSAQWLQRRWERERKGFEEIARERGRKAIVESERTAWERLRKGIEYKAVDLDLEKKERLVEDVREALKLCRD